MVGPETIVWAGVSALLLIVGIVQVFKQAGFPNRYAGILSLILGVIFGVAFAAADPEIELLTGIVQGAMVGLGASGAWSTGKTIRNNGKVDS